VVDIAAWLNRLGLQQYEPAFRENRIEADVLSSLTAEDLKDLGVTLVGDRRRLLDAIAALRPGASTVTDPGPPSEADSISASRSGVRSGDAERRQLTVMFCDLVGSTALAARLDPEDLREVIAAYHRAVAEVVAQFDGFVAKYMGDGVLVYFGYPRAHEDDAERAVRVGLGAIDAVGRLDVGLVKLQARVGIATGLVVVGDLIGEGSAQEQSVVGETPNLAARLQALAGLDAVVIAAGTRRLVGDLFDYRDLGAVEVKGIAAPVQAWQVLCPSVVASRFEALRGSALTRLIGRDEEIELLLRRWARAKAGDGQVVLISGEPGIGKSRLAAALHEQLEDEPRTRLRWFCSTHHQDSAFYPIVTQLESAAGFARDETVAVKLGKLKALLAPAAPGDEELALLAELVSLPDPQTTPAIANFSPQRKRERTREALLDQLKALAREQPLLAVFEDVHWIDPSSRELLDLMIERVRELPVLLVVTFRPEFQPPWLGQAHVTVLALNRLDRREGWALVQAIAGNAVLSSEVVNEVFERADGVPLFVEELTKAVLESADREGGAAAVLSATPSPELAVPATLNASLVARLDRLGSSGKEIAQIGAVLGREFVYDLIQRVSGQGGAELQPALDRLTDSGLVFCRGTPPHATYQFKHALVQDAAYGTLLRGRRQVLHARVAEVLEDRFRDVLERQPELLAHHLTAAGETERAVQQWLKAGQRAIERSANLEAISHLRKGIEALTTLPDTSDRASHELVLQTTLGSALGAAKGQGASDVGQAYARARELCRQVGETPQLFPVLWGLWYFYLARAELRPAREMGEQLLSLAQSADDPALLLAAHRSLGQNFSFLGELARARAHLEQGITLYDAQQHRSLAFLYGQDLGVLCRSWAGLVLWLQGYPDQALQQSREAITLSRELAHLYSQCYALNWAVMLHLYRREGQAAHERTETMMVLARGQGFAMWEASGPIWRGWVLAERGEREEGVSQMRQAVAAWLATGTVLFRPYYLALLAEAYGKAGHTAEGLDLLTEALAVAHTTGERFYEAELYRLKGELLLQHPLPGASEVEACFRHALDIAGHQRAKSLELKATMSLARLWQQQGKRAEAHALLAPIYGWFTEGFDTSDLKEAKALLDELS
jgi:predicted ATPase/class 3 adenylate cyclase